MIHFVKYQLNLLILIHEVICSFNYKAFLFHWFPVSREGVALHMYACVCWTRVDLAALMFCRNVTTCSPPLLVTHEYGSNWIHWKQTSVNWEDNDDHGQLFRGPAFQRGDCSYPPLACSSQQEEVCGRLRSRRGRGSTDLCASFFFCREEAIKQ